MYVYTAPTGIKRKPREFLAVSTGIHREDIKGERERERERESQTMPRCDDATNEPGARVRRGKRLRVLILKAF